MKNLPTIPAPTRAISAQRIFVTAVVLLLSWLAWSLRDVLAPYIVREVIDRFNAARDEEYEEVVDETERFQEEIARERRKGKFAFAELEDEESNLERLRKYWLRSRLVTASMHRAMLLPPRRWTAAPRCWSRSRTKSTSASLTRHAELGSSTALA